VISPTRSRRSTFTRNTAVHDPVKPKPFVPARSCCSCALLSAREAVLHEDPHIRKAYDIREVYASIDKLCLFLYSKTIQVTEFMTNHLSISAPKPCALPDDLPEESAAAIARSMVDIVREAVSVEISVTREMLPCGDVNVSEFVVTLPPSLTEEQQCEIDYWLREVSGSIRYAA